MKLMMLHPGVYKIDTKTISSFIKVFYSNLWDGPEEVKKQLQFEVLSASRLRNEKALVNVMVPLGCQNEKEMPLIKVRQPSQSIFVYHPQAADIRRQELASYFASISEGLVKVECYSDHK